MHERSLTKSMLLADRGMRLKRPRRKMNAQPTSILRVSSFAGELEEVKKVEKHG